MKNLKSGLTLERILDVCCQVYGLMVAEVTEKRKRMNQTECRQMYMYLSFYYTKTSQSEIVTFIGFTSHTTVIHAVRNIQNLIDTDKTVKGKFIAIDDILSGLPEKEIEEETKYYLNLYEAII